MASKAAKSNLGHSKDFIVQNGILRPRKLSSARGSRSSTAHNSNNFDVVSSSHANLRHINSRKVDYVPVMP